MRTVLFFVLIISAGIFLSVSSALVSAYEFCENSYSNCEYAAFSGNCGNIQSNCKSTCTSGRNCYYNPAGDQCKMCHLYWFNWQCAYNSVDTNMPSCGECQTYAECTSSGWTACSNKPDGTSCSKGFCKNGVCVEKQQPCSDFNNKPDNCNSYYFNNNYPCSYCFSTNKCYTKQEYSDKCKPGPLCTDSDGGKNIYTIGTCYDSYSCVKGCIDLSVDLYTIREFYCSGDRCTSENIKCPTNYIVGSEEGGGAYCRSISGCKLVGQSCSRNADCCESAPYCGDKTSDSCSSANPVCQNTKTGMKWAYDPSSCELGYLKGGGCTVNNNLLSRCGETGETKPPDQKTCSSEGGTCCSACVAGTEKSAYNLDCSSGVCCGQCFGVCNDYSGGSNSCPGEKIT